MKRQLFLIYGNEMKLIPLTRGKFTLVDDEDFEYLRQWKWCATKGRNSFYAVRNQWIAKEKKSITILMHKAILNYKGRLPIDHKDHDGLNNQRDNLEISTTSKNALNKAGLQKNNTSGVSGVCWVKKYKKWLACVQVNKKTKHLGRFDTLEDAAMAVINYEPK